MKTLNKTVKKRKTSLAFNLVTVAILLIIFLGTAVAISGYFRFTASLTEEYNDSAFRTAETAVTLVNAESMEKYLEGDNIEPINEYCAGGEAALDAYLNEKSITGAAADEIKTLAAEYKLTLDRMNILCKKQNVTLLYVIAVDTSDYQHFTSVFNCVNSEVYKPWLLGEVKSTTKTDNDVYQRIYRDEYLNGLDRDYVVRNSSLNGAPPHITSLIPIKKADGTVVALTCVQRPMSALREGRSKYVVFVVIITLLVAATVMVGYTVFIRKQIVKPLKKVVKESERFAAENSAPDEPLDENISRVTEISSLAASVSEMESATLKYVESLSEVISEKERVGLELSLASRIQESSIPSQFPAFPNRSEFDLYASMTPAKQVGGDFYDFFLIDDDHLALVIADVSGKGVPAALFMMVNKIIINERALMGGTPSEILEFVNDRICVNNPAEMFITVWLGILEISSGKITAANAGHDNPAIMKKGGNFELFSAKHGVVIGAMTGMKYKDVEINLSAGDKIFLYTDGVPETTNEASEMFKLDGMLSALNELKDLSPEGIIKGVTAKLAEFSGEAPQFDDTTMLCLEFFGGEPVYETELDATDENLEKCLGDVENFLTAAKCPMPVLFKLKIAVEELFVNIAHYAYAPEVGKVKISMSIRDGVFTITFTDGGRAYDPLAAPDPDVTLSADDRQIGGLGVFMVKKIADKVDYKYENEKNIFTMEKRI